jgi:lysyl-tRNA synthetase class 2
MRPEKWAVASTDSSKILDAFKAIGVSEVWAEHVYKAGYTSVEKLKEVKHTAVHQNLNGYRKKNKLDIPALLLEEVEMWFSKS